MPFEVLRINITSDGFAIHFTKPLDAKTAKDPDNYKVSTFTHIYHGGYGGPEVDQTKPEVKGVRLSKDRRTATITLSEFAKGHVHEFDLSQLLDEDQEPLLHKDAYYTVNEVPDS